MDSLQQPHQPLETSAEFEMHKQAANRLNNYTEFYCDSVPPSGFKAPKLPPSEVPTPMDGLRPKKESYSNPAGILDLTHIPEYAKVKNKPDASNGLDELEKLSQLWRDRVAMQKAYNDDKLSHQGIGFNSEGVPYELSQPPPHVTGQNNGQRSSKHNKTSTPTTGYDQDKHHEEKERRRKDKKK